MFGFFEAYQGQLAGLAASILWALTALLFTAAGKRLGVTVVNGLRISLAIVLLGMTHRYLAGHWVPDIISRQVVYLALSGIVGLAIGDQALFTAYVDIGPRVASLVMTTSPLFAALFGWIVLGESLGGYALLGMALTIGGVAWVVLERPAMDRPRHQPLRLRGIVLAFVGAACQAGGLLLSKQGMGHGWLEPEQHLNPQAATLVRMVFAGAGFIPILLLHRLGERRRRADGITPPPLRIQSWSSGVFFMAGGAFVGPFLGVWMSLVASDRAPLGIAQTLCSLTPIFILPMVVFIHKERVSPRAAIGALVAVAGSALLFVQSG